MEMNDSIGSRVTGSIIARFGEKGRKVAIAISAAILMACSGGGGDDHTVVAAEPTTPVPTVPTTPTTPSVEACVALTDTAEVESGKSVIISPLTNDAGPCYISDNISVEPRYGKVSRSGPDTFTYVSTAGTPAGTVDTFTYLLANGTPVTVTVTVVAEPDPVPTSAPIGTITIGDNLGMPTSYTLPAVVDSVGRVVSCTISGLPTGFTLASDNRTLNIVADVGGPTPFSGSRTCDAGVPGNPLIQPINGILNDE